MVCRLLRGGRRRHGRYFRYHDAETTPVQAEHGFDDRLQGGEWVGLLGQEATTQRRQFFYRIVLNCRSACSMMELKRPWLIEFHDLGLFAASLSISIRT